MIMPVKDIPKPGPEYHTGYAQGYADAMRKEQKEREQLQVEVARLRKGIRVAIEYCDIQYCEKHKDWRIRGYIFGCGDKHG